MISLSYTCVEIAFFLFFEKGGKLVPETVVLPRANCVGGSGGRLIPLKVYKNE